MPEQPNTAVAKRTEIEIIESRLKASVQTEQFKEVLADGVRPEKLVALVVQQAKSNGMLMECFKSTSGQLSVLAGMSKAAQLGLDIDGRQAALVPFKNRDGDMLATFMVMFQGRLALIARGGVYTRFSSRVRYHNDQFDMEFGTNEHITHRPAAQDRGDMVGVYAIAWPKDGGAPHFDYMSLDEVRKIRARSRAGNNGPWVSDFEEMAKKTVIHRMSKTLPCDPETSRMLLRADKLEEDAERERFGVVETARAIQSTITPRPTNVEEFKAANHADDFSPDPLPPMSPEESARLDREAHEAEQRADESAESVRESGEFFAGDTKSQSRRKGAQQQDH